MLAFQIMAAIVFVSGPPHWEYKVRMNSTEVPGSSATVDNLQIDVKTDSQDLYLWPSKEYRRRAPSNPMNQLEKPGFMSYQVRSHVAL